MFYDIIFKLGWNGYVVYVSDENNMIQAGYSKNGMYTPSEMNAQYYPTVEISEWIEDNIEGAWIWHNRIKNHLTFQFSRKQDAIQFKLVWG